MIGRFLWLTPLVGVALGSSDGACDAGVRCGTVDANGLTFSCRFAGEGGTAGDVVLLHGFPEWSAMFAPLMRRLAAAGYASVACNQRGYSPGARPPRVADYRYSLLADDVFAVADAAFGANGTFHLVGHDHGAVLGWTLAGGARRARLATRDRGVFSSNERRGDAPRRRGRYSALSVPHPDAFSRGLFGPGADLQQQMTSQYFTVFVRNDSASEDLGALYHGMANADPTEAMGAFDSEAEFQRALWWYAGAFADGVVAMPPTFSATYLLEHGAFAAAALRAAFPAPDDPGAPQRHPTGVVAVPALFVCGAADDAILCNRTFSRDTAAYVTADYAFLAEDCGHDLLACDDAAATRRVEAAVLGRVGAPPPPKA